MRGKDKETIGSLHALFLTAYSAVKWVALLVTMENWYEWERNQSQSILGHAVSFQQEVSMANCTAKDSYKPGFLQLEPQAKRQTPSTYKDRDMQLN